MLAVAHRARLQAGGVRAGIRLGQAIAAEPRHAAEVRQKALAQLSRAECIDHPCHHVVDGDVGRGRRAALRQLLEDQNRIEPRERRAAVVGAHIDAAEAERSRRAQRIRGEDLFLVPLAGKRHHLVAREGARRVLDGALLFAEVEVHAMALQRPTNKHR